MLLSKTTGLQQKNLLKIPELLIRNFHGIFDLFPKLLNLTAGYFEGSAITFQFEYKGHGYNLSRATFKSQDPQR